ncbi:MAG TPA: hypothetical protein VE338_12730 [Ktedonobacterales bacterium]|nr:hypothetical protein [Ktedonobacterales bacterium]
MSYTICEEKTPLIQCLMAQLDGAPRGAPTGAHPGKLSMPARENPAHPAQSEDASP